MHTAEARRAGRARRRRRRVLALLITTAAAAGLTWASTSFGGSPAGPLAIPDAGAPNAILFGASPAEAPGEVWGVTQEEIVRYDDANGWQSLPAPIGASGQTSYPAGALGGEATAGGGVALFATDATGQRLLTRDPGGPFRAALAPALPAGGSLFAANGAGPPLLAAIDEASGATGALLVPDTPGSPPASVLHFDGSAWASEPICAGPSPVPCTPPGAGFDVIGIGASGPANAWLLATDAAAGPSVELYSRDLGSGTWRLRSLGGLGAVEARPRRTGQPLTVTAKGIWIDATLGVGGASAEATLYYDTATEAVTAGWCNDGESLGPLCARQLGSPLPAGGSRSFAWPPDGQPEDPFGTRTITGVGAGALLVLKGEAFERLPTAGGDAGIPGAALVAPEEGWLSSSQVPIHLTRAEQQPAPRGLQPWPVPFRYPLLAVAGEFGSPVGALDSEAIAVGEHGELARYTSETGWAQEAVQRGPELAPRLRAVAWPKYGPFAVGDDGAMWVGLRGTAKSPEWEPDGGAPPGIEHVDLTGIAFNELGGDQQPSANRVPGWVVGTGGTLLGFAAPVRQWEKYAVPEGVDQDVDFSSVAFAGNEALATYKRRLPGSGFAADEGADGGLLVNEGSGWKVDLGALEALGNAVPEKVAGLPDGGAVLATLGGRVFEREGPHSPWLAAPRGTDGYPAALAAFREAGKIRAAISIGSAPDPYEPPISAYLVRQTASGWRDEENEAFPLPSGSQEGPEVDYPAQPDSVLGLALDPEGDAGWAVGGQTGEIAQSKRNREEIQTATILRYPAAGAPAPTGVGTAPIEPPGPGVEFAIGGGAQCAGPCADLAGTGIGPDRWISQAFGQAAEIKGLSAILYTGAGVAEGLGQSLSPPAYTDESRRYASRLSGAAGTEPVFAAPAPSDLDGAGSLSTFAQAFSSFGAPFGTGPPGPGVTPVSSTTSKQHYYSFDSKGNGGTVRVIVLDYTAPLLGNTQRCWLARQLFDAGEHGKPAIVVGNRDFSPENGVPEAAEDDPLTDAILLGVAGTDPGGCVIPGATVASSASSAASAYFFDYAGRNHVFSFTLGSRTLPVFGTGSLGYGEPPAENEGEGEPPGILTTLDSIPAYLLASVDTSHRDPGSNQAPVSVEGVRSVGQLSIQAILSASPTAAGQELTPGSPVAFVPIARRPIAGMRCHSYPTCTFSPNPYPQSLFCSSPSCGSEIPADFAFSSSDPEVARFVQPGSGTNGAAEFIFPEGANAPVLSPGLGILCPIDPGTTTITVSAGGISYSRRMVVGNEGRGTQCGLEAPTTTAAEQPPPATAQTPSPSLGVSAPPLAPGSSAPKPATPHPAPPSTAAAPTGTFLTVPTPVIVPAPSPPLAQAIPPSAALPATLPAPAPAPVPSAAPSPAAVQALAPVEEGETAINVARNQMAALPRQARVPAALTAFHPAPDGQSTTILYALPVLAGLAGLGLALALGSALSGADQRSFAHQRQDLG